MLSLQTVDTDRLIHVTGAGARADVSAVCTSLSERGSQMYQAMYRGRGLGSADHQAANVVVELAGKCWTKLETFPEQQRGR